MIPRLAVAVGVIIVVVVVTQVLNRRRVGDGPTITGNELPSHVDRSDFVAPNAPHLIVVFSSATCLSCADVWSWVQSLESPEVAVQDVEVKRDPALHERYSIDSVPATLIIDRAGVVVHQVLGPIGLDDQSAISRYVTTPPAAPATSAGGIDQ